MNFITNEPIKTGIVYTAPWSHGRGNCALVKINDVFVKMIAPGRGEYGSAQLAPEAPERDLVEIANKAYDLICNALIVQPLSSTIYLQLQGPFDCSGHTFAFLNGTEVYQTPKKGVVEIQVSSARA
jgi:hypothetical protein